MSKLIYVDRLKKDILALQDCYNGFSDTYDKACIIGVIDEQPTIEERKTGKWIRKKSVIDCATFVGEECSECGYFKSMGHANFCPNCGADMRGNNDA